MPLQTGFPRRIPRVLRPTLLEFVWGDGSRSWPDDYPEDGREVVVTGRFETYSEGEATYAHLVDASLEEA